MKGLFPLRWSREYTNDRDDRMPQSWEPLVSHIYVHTCVDDQISFPKIQLHTGIYLTYNIILPNANARWTRMLPPPLPLPLPLPLFQFPCLSPSPSIPPLLRPPLPMQPAIQKVQAGFGLVQGHHVPGGMDAHEGEIAAAFHLAVLVALSAQAEGGQVDLVVGRLAGPIERFCPGGVAEPVADEVGVALRDGQLERGKKKKEISHRTRAEPGEPGGGDLLRISRLEFAPGCPGRADGTVSSSRH